MPPPGVLRSSHADHCCPSAQKLCSSCTVSGGQLRSDAADREHDDEEGMINEAMREHLFRLLIEAVCDDCEMPKAMDTSGWCDRLCQWCSNQCGDNTLLRRWLEVLASRDLHLNSALIWVSLEGAHGAHRHREWPG